MFPIEVAKKIQTAPALELSEDDIVVDDLFEDIVSPVEGAFNLWTRLFYLMFYLDLSPFLMMFMTLHLWIEHFRVFACLL